MENKYRTCDLEVRWWWVSRISFPDRVLAKGAKPGDQNAQDLARPNTGICVQRIMVEQQRGGVAGHGKKT